MMDMNRAGETGKVPVRSSRFFYEERCWYFRTREGADVGPYNTQKAAKKGLQDFIDFISLADPKTLSQFYASLTGKSAHLHH
jgi:hypothetical protein